MSATLSDILNYELIKVNDSVEFVFKGYFFRAKIAKGGLLVGCTLYKPHAKKSEKILTNVSSFTNLTSWTEACLQDVLEEYFTRYSSWKRVYHVETRQTMSELRDRCKLANGKPDSTELYREIHRLEKTCEEMRAVLKANDLYDAKWDVLTIPKKKKPARVAKKRKLKNKRAFEQMQDIVVQSLDA